MPQLVEIDDFYEAGKKLAKHFADSKGKDISIATLQALIRDFLPQHRELQEALRSIVARPEFLQLMLVGSKIGLAQKCAFVENLKKIYSAETVSAADSLVCGMIGLSVTTIQSESEAQMIVVDTLTQQRKASGVEIEQQKDLPTEEETLQGNSIEIAENLRPASPSDSLGNTELDWTVSLALGLVVVVVAFFAGCIRDGIRDRLPEAKVKINRKLSAIAPSSPYHVRVGSPRQMPNNTGVSNELLAEAILASAILQCESMLDHQNGGYAEGIKRYRSYIDKKNIENRVTNSNTFKLLSASLKETMVKNRKGVFSGSCGSISDNKAVEKVKEWLM